jgi:hypothetical protein
MHVKDVNKYSDLRQKHMLFVDMPASCCLCFELFWIYSPLSFDLAFFVTRMWLYSPPCQLSCANICVGITLRKKIV